MNIFVADDSISHTKPFKNSCCSLWLKILSANQKFKIILLTVQKHKQTHQPQFALFAKNTTSVYIEGKLHSVFSFTQTITLRWPSCQLHPPVYTRATLPDQPLLGNKVQMGMQYITVEVMPFHLYFTRQSDNPLVKDRWVCIPPTTMLKIIEIYLWLLLPKHLTQEYLAYDDCLTHLLLQHFCLTLSKCTKCYLKSLLLSQFVWPPLFYPQEM